MADSTTDSTTTTHLSGLAQTSIDVTGIIQAMLAAKAAPEKTWLADQGEIAEDVAAWSDISSAATDLTDSLDTLRSYELWNKMGVEPSDSTKVSGAATSAAVAATYTVSIAQLAQAHSVRSRDFVSATADLTAGGSPTLTDGDQFEIGGVTFTVGKDEYGQTLGNEESLTSLAAKINYASSSMTAADRVTAAVIAAGATEHYLVLTRVNTGDTCIDSADTLGNPLQALQIRSTAGPGDNYVTNLVDHQDAGFTVNGIDIVRSSNRGLTDVISGVTLNLLDETISDVTLTVSPDTEGAKAAILDFVDKYNATAAKLTDYGKIVMTGSMLSPKGETVASTGELYNDSLVSEIARNIRQQATGTKFPVLNNVNASYTYGGRTGIMCSLQDIGISTTGEENTLSVVDETRLDSLLQSNFSQVEQLFRGVFNETNGYQNGIASDFYAYSNGISQTLTGSIAHHVQTLNDQNEALQTRIDDMETYLKDYEQELWNRFTAMDDAISRLQSSLGSLKNITG